MSVALGAAGPRGGAVLPPLGVGRRGWGALALVAAVLTLLALGACGRAERNKGLSERVIPLGQPVPKGGGVYKVGSPYQIDGRWYTPREDPNYDRVGTASWYGELFHGRRTANGEIYDMTALSAAHPTLPMPVYVRVTNLANGRWLVVRVNDRGPYARDRIIDLSARAAELLGFREQGTAPVRVTYLGRAPLNGDDSYERQVLASQRWLRFASRQTRRLAAATASLPATSLASAKPADAPSAIPVKVAGASPAADPTPVGSIERREPEQGRSAIASPDAPVYLQAGSFRQRQNAERLRDKLADLGTVELNAADIGGATYYRVRMGPFVDPGIAEEALRRAENLGATGARLVAE